jgi:hypothetical protein
VIGVKVVKAVAFSGHCQHVRHACPRETGVMVEIKRVTEEYLPGLWQIVRDD